MNYLSEWLSGWMDKLGHPSKVRGQDGNSLIAAIAASINIISKPNIIIVVIFIIIVVVIIIIIVVAIIIIIIAFVSVLLSLFGTLVRKNETSNRNFQFIYDLWVFQNSVIDHDDDVDDHQHETRGINDDVMSFFDSSWA